MTEQEARIVFDIARSADNYCTECQRELCLQLTDAFPQWPWMEWLSDNFGAPKDDDFADCAKCGDEHPVGVLEDALCPKCCDE